MSSTTVFHNMTSARADRAGGGSLDEIVVFSITDGTSSMQVIVKTAAQADQLAKAGAAARDMLTTGDPGETS